MTINDMSTLASVTLAGSLAMERLVTIAKTAFPWLTEERTPRPGESVMRADQRRRLSVLSLTIVASVVTAYFVGDIPLGDKSKLPWLIFALLISGGSAFWSNIIGYTSAAKDIAVQNRQTAVARGVASGAASAGAIRSP